MRIAGPTLYQQTLQSLQTNQASIYKLQSQLASGLRVQTAADDPIAAGQALNVEKAYGDVTRWQSNVGTLQSRLGLEDAALGNVSQSLSQIRSLAVQANNPSLNDQDRQSIALSIKQQISNILGQANTQDGNGRYIFGGTQDLSPPFSVTTAGPVYSGNSTLSLFDVGPNSQVAGTDPGDDTFLRLKSGDGSVTISANAANTGSAYVTDAHLTDPSVYNGGQYTISFNGGQYQVVDSASVVVASGVYTSSSAITFNGATVTLTGEPADGDSFTLGPAQPQDLFTSLQNLYNVVSASGSTGGASALNQTAYYSALSALEGAESHIANVRGGVGAREQTLDLAAEQLSNLSTQYQKTLTGLQSLDYASATAQLSQTQLTLQAAEQSYAAVQGLSLFNYLR